MEANGVTKADVGAQVTVGVLAFGAVGSVCALATQGASVAAVAGAGFAGSALGVLGSAWALKLKHKNPDVKMQKLIEQAREKFPGINNDPEFIQALVDNPPGLKDRLEAECNTQFAAEFMEVREQLGKAHGHSIPRIMNAISPERNQEMKGKMSELRTKVVGGGTMVALGVASAFTGGIAGAVALGAMGATYATQEHYVGKAKQIQKTAVEAQKNNLKDAVAEESVENKQDQVAPAPDVAHTVDATVEKTKEETVKNEQAVDATTGLEEEGDYFRRAVNVQDAGSRLMSDEEKQQAIEELRSISMDDFEPKSNERAENDQGGRKFLERSNGVAKLEIQRDITDRKEVNTSVDFDAKVQKNLSKIEKTEGKSRENFTERSFDVESAGPGMRR